MREILFRGKRIDDGKWIYGNLTVLGECAFISENMGFNKTVIPETVGQFTGLTDKNGTKIFEGDIVKGDLCYPDNDIALIEYQEDSMGFCVVPIYEKDYGKAFEITEEVEVIGNIHDNPELLEVEK